MRPIIINDVFLARPVSPRAFLERAQPAKAGSDAARVGEDCTGYQRPRAAGRTIRSHGGRVRGLYGNRASRGAGNEKRNPRRHPVGTPDVIAPPGSGPGPSAQPFGQGGVAPDPVHHHTGTLGILWWILWRDSLNMCRKRPQWWATVSRRRIVRMKRRLSQVTENEQSRASLRHASHCEALLCFDPLR
jgi:hypothetical protein